MEPPSRSYPRRVDPGGDDSAPRVTQVLAPEILVPEVLVPEVLVPEVLVIDTRWRRLVPRLARLVGRAAVAGGGAGTVVLERDLRVRRLNARHRGRNRSTNVLTFENSGGVPGVEPGGDIVLALETVRREAQAAGRPASHHLAHLVVHGALHLRGHDHHGVGEARRMEMHEARILHRLGVPNPWKPRAVPQQGGGR